MQTDWGLSGLRFRVGSDPSKLSSQIETPLVEVAGALGMASDANNKLFGAYIPLELPDPSSGNAPRGITSMLRSHCCQNPA
jgi:hypothetical protein